MYVNDNVNGIESETQLFADDTCIFASGFDPAETAIILNRDLELINNWATKWKVSFNPGKSKDVIFLRKGFYLIHLLLFSITCMLSVFTNTNI